MERKEEKINPEDTINFNKENLMYYIFGIMSDKNVEIAGVESDKWLMDIDKKMEESGVVGMEKANILDSCSDAITLSANNAYKAGFKEGVRLLRTLMMY